MTGPPSAAEKAAPPPTSEPKSSSAPESTNAPAASSQDLEAARKRISDLEAALIKMKKHSDKQVKEALQKAEAAKVASHTQPNATATPPTPEAPAAASTEETAAIKKELEASQKDAKEQAKKLNKLAQAYKQLDQKKAELEGLVSDVEGKLQQANAAVIAAQAETAKAKVEAKPLISPALIKGIYSMLATQKSQVAELRATVMTNLQQQLPAALEDVVKSKSTILESIVEKGAQEWKDKYNAESEKRRKLHNQIQEMKGNIRVYCRVRPLNARESGSCISFPNNDEITIRNEAAGMKKTWQFNQVFNEKSTQAMLFDGIRDLVVSMIDGYNVCIFAYGQTGAGKTHSMQGTPDNPGIYQRTFNELFKVANERPGWHVELKGSIVEIYNEEIRDLLLAPGDKKTKLQVRQGKEGNHVPGLTMEVVKSGEAVDNLLAKGGQNRTVAATDMNAHSSRSHLLVMVHGSIKTADGKQMNSCITLVDLAGSERIAKSGVTGDRAKEAIAINKSLAALGDVINSRATKSSHTPYRNSPLTHLLQDSLGGDSKTLMLMQINPCQDHVEESLCSLQFGARVNNVEMSSAKK